MPLSDEELTFALTRRSRQKHINIRISFEGEVLVSAPAAAPLSRIRAAVQRKQSWILRHQDDMRQRRVATDPLRTLLFMGQSLSVEVNPNTDGSRRDRVRHEPSLGRIVVLSKESDSELHKTALRRWIMRQARTALPKLAVEVSLRTGVEYEKLYLRNQRTRWGSSSAKGNISVNWRAVMAPPSVQEYLMVHELAHQRQMNHSSDFWDLVGTWFPEYEAAGLWLRTHGHLLALLR